MPKPRDKTTNWKQYNRALINPSSLTFWIDEETIAEWKVKKHGTDGKRRAWRRLHIAVDTSTHEIVAAELI